MLVSPVSIVCNRVLYEHSNKWKHLLVTNAGDETVDSLFAKGHIIFVLIFARETFLWSNPVSVDVFVDVNHKLEDYLKNIPDKSVVSLGKGWFTLDDCDDKLHGLVADRIVSEILVGDDRLERLIEIRKVSPEEVWLDFSELIEFDKSVLQHSLLFLLKGLCDDSCHERE